MYIVVNDVLLHTDLSEVFFYKSRSKRICSTYFCQSASHVCKLSEVIML